MTIRGKSDDIFYPYLVSLQRSKELKVKIEHIKKSPRCIIGGIFRNNELAMTYSHMGNPTLPSARRGFTSEFGKGSGGSLLLLSPAQLFMTTC